jgi:hypothetical protein
MDPIAPPYALVDLGPLTGAVQLSINGIPRTGGEGLSPCKRSLGQTTRRTGFGGERVASTIFASAISATSAVLMWLFCNALSRPPPFNLLQGMC